MAKQYEQLYQLYKKENNMVHILDTYVEYVVLCTQKKKKKVEGVIGDEIMEL